MDEPSGGDHEALPGATLRRDSSSQPNLLAARGRKGENNQIRADILALGNSIVDLFSFARDLGPTSGEYRNLSKNCVNLQACSSFKAKCRKSLDRTVWQE
jgi:hypothetical protein